MAATHVEREDKFDVDAAFALPDLAAALGGLQQDARVVHLESTYFDTAEHALLIRRLTLRRRHGDVDEGWQLKVPHGAARLEVQLPPQAGEAVPPQLADLVAGAALGRPLAPIAVVRTERRLTRLRTPSGTVLAEVADDRVHAAATGEAARVSEWREVEVELVDGDEELLARCADALMQAGAERSSSRSKLARALGPDADAAADAAENATDAAGLLGAYLHEQLAVLAAGDVSLRRGLDPVHKTRVAARRIRSVLRVFSPVLDVDGRFDTELSWYQDLLGEVRDRQVQRDRFAALVAGLPPELVLGPVAADLEQTLVAELARALDDVRAALRSDRYRDLLLGLERLCTDVPTWPGTTARDLQRLARKARRKTRKRLAAAVESGDADALHRARKAAKRSRYALEVVRPVAGKQAARAIKRHTRLQDVLGQHQDSVLATGYLRRLGAAASVGGRNGFTYGLLFEREQQTQRRLRARVAGQKV